MGRLSTATWPFIGYISYKPLTTREWTSKTPHWVNNINNHNTISINCIAPRHYSVHPGAKNLNLKQMLEVLAIVFYKSDCAKKLSLNAMELNRCTLMERRWKTNGVFVHCWTNPWSIIHFIISNIYSLKYKSLTYSNFPLYCGSDKEHGGLLS